MSTADRRMKYAAALSHAADDLVALDLRDPDQRHRLTELAGDVRDLGECLAELADELSD